MKIDDLVQLLDNRLREFKLSKDYAKMNGDLERMNAADKEIIGLEDTLYQLNLLIDTSKSAKVKETSLKEAITDGSVAVLDEYNITSYATDPMHEKRIMNILSKMGVMDTEEKIDDYIRRKALSSPLTGEMVKSAADAYDVDERLMLAIMEQDSRFGTLGVAVRTRNPGNVGNDDDGNTRHYDSWQEGVTAVAEWLNRHRGVTEMPEDPQEDLFTEPIETATTTPSVIEPTVNVTPATITSTPLEINEASSTSNGASTSTSTPVVTTTPVTASSTPTTSTTTPLSTSSTPLTTSSSGQATSTLPTTVGTPTQVGATTSTSTSTPTTTSTSTSTPVSSTPTSTPTSTTSTPLELNEASSTSNGAGTATSTDSTGSPQAAN